MDPLTLGILSAGAGPLLDLFTGASGKQKRAQEAQQSQLQAIMDRIKGDMGNSAADSLGYKTMMAQLDKGYDRQSNANNQYAAASGASDEARLGQLATQNDGYNTQQLGALSQADQQRRQLQNQYDSVASQKAGFGVQQADTGVQQQNALLGGAMSMVPYLLGGSSPFTSEATKDIAQGTTAAPVPNPVNQSVTAIQKPVQQIASTGGNTNNLSSLLGRMNASKPQFDATNYAFKNSGFKNGGWF